jgi:diguanylate cyclase (GGDEF)-like protein
MKAQVRDADVVCRSGGEEFIIFLDGSNMDVAYEIAERIRLSIESDITSLEEGTTISIGVAQWYGDSTPISLTLELADNALYAAKRNGRNRTELFS